MAEERIDGRSVRFAHRRGEILDAVMDHVLEHGIAAVSFRTLAQTVGVSHVTLRHHFGTKEKLLAEIFDVIRAREPIPPSMAADESSDLIHALWRSWTDGPGQRHFRLLFEAYGQALMNPGHYELFLAGVVHDRLDVIRRLAIGAGCPPEDAERYATVLLAQLRGLQQDLLATGDRVRVDAALENFLAMLEGERAGWRPVTR